MRYLLTVIFVLAAVSAAMAQSDVPKRYSNSDEVPRINLADAKKAFDDGSAIFVDSRSADSFKALHVKGAISIPFGSTDDFSSLPKGKSIIVYCT